MLKDQDLDQLLDDAVLTINSICDRLALLVELMKRTAKDNKETENNNNEYPDW